MTHLTRNWIKLVQSVTEGQHGNFIEIPRGMVLSLEPLALDAAAKIPGWSSRNNLRRLRAAGIDTEQT